MKVKKERKMGKNKKVPLNKNFDTLQTYSDKHSKIQKKYKVEMKKFLIQTNQKLRYLNKMLKLQIEFENLSQNFGENGANIWTPESWETYWKLKQNYAIQKHRYACYESNYELEKQKFEKLENELASCLEKKNDFSKAKLSMYYQGILQLDESGHFGPVIIPESFLPDKTDHQYDGRYFD